MGDDHLRSATSTFLKSWEIEFAGPERITIGRDSNEGLSLPELAEQYSDRREYN